MNVIMAGPFAEAEALLFKLRRVRALAVVSAVFRISRRNLAPFPPEFIAKFEMW